MARVSRGVTARARHKKVIKRAKGYYGRRKMTWDGENMKITNFEDANQFVGRSYREGWEL